MNNFKILNFHKKFSRELKISKIEHMHWYVCQSQLGHLIWDEE